MANVRSRPPGPPLDPGVLCTNFVWFRSRRLTCTTRGAVAVVCVAENWPLLTLTFVFSLSSSLSASGYPGNSIFMGTHILTQLEGICKKINTFFCNLKQKYGRWFLCVFSDFYDVRSWLPGPRLVPLDLYLFVPGPSLSTLYYTRWWSWLTDKGTTWAGGVHYTLRSSI